MGLFKRKYQADTVVYRSPDGKPAYYIQWELGSKHNDLRKKAKFCIEEILEGRGVAMKGEELGSILVPLNYSDKSNFEGVALLHICVEEGEKRPIIEWTIDIKVVKKSSIFSL